MKIIVSFIIILISINVFADKLPERYCGTWVYLISSHRDTNPKGFEEYFPQRNKDGKWHILAKTYPDRIEWSDGRTQFIDKNVSYMIDDIQTHFKYSLIGDCNTLFIRYMIEARAFTVFIMSPRDPETYHEEIIHMYCINIIKDKMK